MAVEVGKISIMKLLRFVLGVGLATVVIVAVLVVLEGRGGGGSDVGEGLVEDASDSVADSGEYVEVLATGSDGGDITVMSEAVSGLAPFVPTEAALALESVPQRAPRLEFDPDAEFFYPILEHQLGGRFYFKVPAGYLGGTDRRQIVRKMHNGGDSGNFTMDVRYPSMLGLSAETQRVDAAYAADPENNPRWIPFRESLFITLKTLPPPKRLFTVEEK